MEPEVAWYVPAPQSVHATAPEAAVYVPPGQLRHVLCPPWCWYVPALHVVHEVLADDSVDLEPAPHAGQLLAPGEAL
jgi:hypothetical protein